MRDNTNEKNEMTNWKYLQLQYLLELERLNINGLSRGKILEVSKKFDTDRTTVSRFFKRCYENGLLAEDLEFTLPMETIMNNYKQMLRGIESFPEKTGNQRSGTASAHHSSLVNGLNAQDLQAVIDSRENTSVPQLGIGEKSIDIIGCLDQGRFDVRIVLFQVYHENHGICRWKTGI